MNRQRIRQLREELEAERISLAELAEIDGAAAEAGIEIKEGMLAGDILDELESIAKPGLLKLRDPAQDTPELAKDDTAITSYDYELGRFRKYFTTPFEQYAEHVGKPFTMVKRLPDAEAVDDGPGEDMWLIRFEDGTEIEAWGHEVCLLWIETDEPCPDNALCYPPHQDDNWRLVDGAPNNWMGTVEDKAGEEIMDLTGWAARDFNAAFAFAKGVVKTFNAQVLGIRLEDYGEDK